MSEYYLLTITRCFGAQLTFYMFFSVSGRTFPTHPYFQAPLGPGQMSLYNILKAYSLLDPEVSFNFLASVQLSPYIKWASRLPLRFQLTPSLVCLDFRFVFVVLVGGLLPGSVLHCWSASVTHGGTGCIQPAQISNV